VPRSPFAAVALAAVICAGACQQPGARPAAPPRPELLEAGPGPADAVVRAALADARRDRRRVVVYVSATWCKPCEEFQKSLRSGALDEYLPSLRLVKFDHDRDIERLTAAGYDGPWLPRFVLPDDNGRGTDRRVEGGTKAADTVFTSIGPRLQQLLGYRRS
jgi:hypothetical protein